MTIGRIDGMTRQSTRSAGRRGPFLVATIGLLLVGMLGCAEPKWQELVLEPEVAVVTSGYRKEYVLDAGDTIDVVVVNHPVVTRSCEIRSDGYITLPLLDDIKAAGMTPMALDKKLTELLSARLQDPEVTVVATSLRPPSITVVGEVVTPVVVPLRDAPTAAEAVALAGGFTKISAPRSVVVLRTTDDGRCIGMQVDTGSLKGQSASYLALRGVALEADDVVFVPRSRIGQFNVFLELYVNNVLGSANIALGSYTQAKWLEVLEKQLDQLGGSSFSQRPP